MQSDGGTKMKKVMLLIMIPFLLYTAPVLAEENGSLQEEIIYDILVDRFHNGDATLSEQADINDPYAYHGGDLQGITSKLDRIKQLGFTTIALSPIMENAISGYHGYWIEDFYSIEDQFGTTSDLNDLIEEAHGRGIKVILELPINYIASTHPLLDDPSKEDWFKQNQLETTDSTTWLDHVVVMNQDNEEVQAYLIDVAKYWMTETDIDGFKLHAADQSSPLFLEKLTATIKENNPDFYILANMLTDQNIEDIRAIPHVDGIENPSMLQKMNEVFTLVDQPVSVLLDETEENGEDRDLLLVDNKNTARFSNNFADEGRNALTTWKLALTYMYTTPGIPMIYQGSELPMYGPGFPHNQSLVLFNSTDPDLEEFFERISSLRSEFPVLQYGDMEVVGTNEGLSVFKRTYENETMYIAINNDSVSRAISVDNIDSDLQLRGLLGDNTVRENSDGEFKIGIERESTEVYMIEENTGINFWFIGFVAGVFIIFAIAIAYLSHKQKKREANEE